MKTKFRVVNVINRGEVVSEWVHPLEKLLIQISSGADRLAQNYSPSNVKLQEHLSFDILLDDKDNIVSFGGVYNGGRYPPGVYRILNRTWVHEDYRVRHGSFKYLTSDYILPVQIANFHDDLKLIFVSRERVSGRLFLKRWQKHRPADEGWVLSENFVQVVPGVEKKSCFQYICTRRLGDAVWNPNEVTEEQWNLLPD